MSRSVVAWTLVGLLVVGLAVLWTILTDVRPAYDAYGWLVWGHQALHLNLDTGAAPSWKPLPFLFTLPYALAGRGALWLWMVTATAAAFAAPVFGGRIAWALTRRGGGGRFAATVAALIAGLAVLGIAGWWHFVLISTCDPLMVMLSLAAVDAWLGGRRRAGWVFLVLLCLGRPEAWPVAFLYAVAMWRAHPEMRRTIVVGALAVPLLWFGLARLTSPSWFIASDVDLQSTVPLPGDRLTAVLNGFVSLYELPMQIAVLVAVGVALIRRATVELLIAASALVWVVVEVALGLHGWAPVPRYMFEPAALLVVLAGAAVGRLLAAPAWPVRIACVAALIALGVAMVPHARLRARLAHNGIVLGQTWTRVINRLQDVVDTKGRNRILACGQPVTSVSFQSILAWEMNENVADVGWDPPTWYQLGQPEVEFDNYFAGWKVYPVHSSASSCTGIPIQTASN